MTSLAQQTRIMKLSTALLKDYPHVGNRERMEAMMQAKAMLTRRTKLLLLLAD